MQWIKLDSLQHGGIIRYNPISIYIMPTQNPMTGHYRNATIFFGDAGACAHVVYLSLSSAERTSYSFPLNTPLSAHGMINFTLKKLAQAQTVTSIPDPLSSPQKARDEAR